MLFLDIEVYRNYFLFETLCAETGEITRIESFNDSHLDRGAIKAIMKNNLTVGFNTRSYDLLVLYCALYKNYTNQQLKDLSDEIIESQSLWSILKAHAVDIPPKWDHIDLIEVAPGKSSLKIYGGRLKAAKMQDLPIEPSSTIQPMECDAIARYCVNDLETTKLLYETLRPQIELREAMSKQYGIDLRSKSDAQIAEAVIKSELEEVSNGKRFYAPKLASPYVFKYRDPKIIRFKNGELKKLFERILKETFTLAANGSVKMPDWLAAQKVKIGNAEYQMGIGGLHSCEKNQYVEADERHLLLDMDVASYYPSIILQQKLAPQGIGSAFLNIYEGIVDQRLTAKKKCVELQRRIAVLERRLKDAVTEETL